MGRIAKVGGGGMNCRVYKSIICIQGEVSSKFLRSRAGTIVLTLDNFHKFA